MTRKRSLWAVASAAVLPYPTPTQTYTGKGADLPVTFVSGGFGAVLAVVLLGGLSALVFAAWRRRKDFA